MKDLKIYLVGFGNIGVGFAKILAKKAEAYRERYGLNILLTGISFAEGSYISGKGIPLDEAIGYATARKLQKHKLYTKESFDDVIGKVDADILVEATPTNIDNGQPGLKHINAAFDRGMHVVTSNKSIVVDFHKLVERAEKAGLEFKYEATVGGGIPIFSMYRQCLQSQDVISIRGILNGTTNYILTRMYEDGLSFDSALQQAKEMGIAEANSSYDIDGIDSTAKLVILSNAILGTNHRYKDVKREGIANISLEAIQMAKKHGFAIRLIGQSDGRHLMVKPRLVSVRSPLNVGGTLNALEFETELLDTLTIVGKGAGSIESSSAVMSDVISIGSRCCANKC